MLYKSSSCHSIRILKLHRTLSRGTAKGHYNYDNGRKKKSLKAFLQGKHLLKNLRFPLKQNCIILWSQQMVKFPKSGPTKAPSNATIAPSYKKIRRLYFDAPIATKRFDIWFFSIANTWKARKILKLAMPMIYESVRNTKSFSILIGHRNRLKHVAPGLGFRGRLNKNFLLVNLEFHLYLRNLFRSFTRISNGTFVVIFE